MINLFGVEICHSDDRNSKVSFKIIFWCFAKSAQNYEAKEKLEAPESLELSVNSSSNELVYP